jgi:signal transduction histidine kinase
VGRLFRSDPNEDRRLEELVIPSAIWHGFHLLAFVLIALAVYMTVGDPDSLPDPHSTNQALAAGLLALAAAPWVVELWRDLSPRVFIPLALGPLATIGLLRHLQVVDLHGIAGDIVLLVVVIMVVPLVACAPRQVAAATVLSSAGIFLLWTTTTWGYDKEFGLSGTAIWLTALCFSTGAAATYRFAMLALIDAREAQELVVRQEASDQRQQAARDIHDVVAHTLAVTMLHITAARMAVRRGAADDAEEALVEAESHGRASLEDVRRIVRLLRADDDTPVEAAQPDLRDVERLVDCYRIAGRPVELSLELDEHRVQSATRELVVYRVLQEALANSARHGTGPASVVLRATHSELELRVDNPIAAKVSRTRRRGSGLAGMRERVAAVDGTLDARPRNGHWVVDLVVPLPAPAGATSELLPDRGGRGDGWRRRPHIVGRRSSTDTPTASAP